jgi:hypothetical protein
VRHHHLTLLAVVAVLPACSSSGLDPSGEVDALTVRGTAVDFVDGRPLDQATIATAGVTPAPSVAIDGADFTLAGVPAHSVFQIVAGSPPGHRQTYAAIVTVDEDDVEDVEARVVSEATIAALAEAFGADDPSTVVLIRAVDDDGEPRGGVPADAFDLPGAALGPFFLDADLAPDPELAATSASGWVAYLDVDPGLVALADGAGSGFTVEMPSAPASAGTATVVDAVVREGELEPAPTDVAYDEVVAVFERRGCQACHSGNGAGRDLGDLTLDGSRSLSYRELLEEPAVADGLRVDREAPAASLLLTMPSAESPADGHPTVVFASEADDDYRLILAWIEEGAIR